MKRNIEKLKAIDKCIKVGLVLILILSIVLLLMVINYMDVVDSYAEAPAEVKRIPVEELMHHEEEKAYQRWVNTIECQDQESGKYRIEVTQEDIDLMARVVMSEASILSQDAKQAVATTIVNRVLLSEGEFATQNTVKEVVYHGAAYSVADNGDPDETCYKAVYDSLTYEGFPLSMIYFRQDHYHSFGYGYMHIDNTYFSTYEDIFNEPRS